MMTKRNAFLIHLGFSLLIFFILLLMIIYIWYPAPYFDTAYRMKWIKIIAFVDLVLGPGLTLLVFKPGKPSLKMDMTVVLLLQLSALSWGVYNAWSVHPKMTVYFDNQVFCLDRNEIKAAKADRQFAHSPITEQITVVLPYPETTEEKKEYLDTGDRNQPMVYRLGEKFVAATTELTAKLDQEQRDILPVINSSKEFKTVWARFIQNYDVINPEWRFYPFICLQKKRTLVLDRSSNKVEAVLDIELPIEFIMN